MGLGVGVEGACSVDTVVAADTLDGVKARHDETLGVGLGPGMRPWGRARVRDEALGWG